MVIIAFHLILKECNKKKKLETIEPKICNNICFLCSPSFFGFFILFRFRFDTCCRCFHLFCLCDFLRFCRWLLFIFIRLINFHWFHTETRNVWFHQFEYDFLTLNIRCIQTQTYHNRIECTEYNVFVMLCVILIERNKNLVSTE